jgi:acetyl-CoA carboxylase biotin carboxylase subunit
VIRKVLIANRGEIALRVIRACRELGISTVAVYSTADADSLHVRFADEDVCIGPPQPGQSYLDSKRLIAAAEIAGADAVHPGYGFLAESAEFAQLCLDCDLEFIGPPPSAITAMGDKAGAKRTMKDAGVPVTPGSDGLIEGAADVLRFAGEFGYPLIMKATAGGGGKGMRVVRSDSEVERAFNLARGEAGSAFGNAGLYVEKYLENPRHVEVQVLADKHGNVVHLGERDCSVQRRHQKLVEESPSPAVTPEVREKMGEAAVAATKAVGYVSAGTVEFLLDDGVYYFMEMNTRVQVEHPVTEEVTGIDIVRRQLRIARGEALDFGQDDVRVSGHAIECRINAEDPSDGFAPSPGKITTFHVPGGHGVRVDTAAYAGYVIPPFYDSLIAKLIAHGDDRDDAVRKMRGSLDEFVIEGIPTTIPFQRRVVDDPRFRSGVFGTNFVDKLIAGGA